MDNISGLPTIEQDPTLKMVMVQLRNHPKVRVETNIIDNQYDADGELTGRILLLGDLITVNDERIKGFMPSKTWYDPNYGLVMLYYVNTTLPMAVRPFKGNTFMLVSKICDYKSIFEYDVNLRLYIDQIYFDHAMHLVTLFGEDTYDQLIHKVIE